MTRFELILKQAMNYRDNIDRAMNFLLTIDGIEWWEYEDYLLAMGFKQRAINKVLREREIY